MRLALHIKNARFNLLSTVSRAEGALLCLLCVMCTVSQPAAARLQHIPMRLGTYREPTCRDVRQSVVSDVFRASGFVMGNRIGIHVHDNQTSIVTIVNPRWGQRGVALNVTLNDARWHYFLFEEDGVRCRNVLRERYRAVCVWVSELSTRQGNKTCCLALAIKPGSGVELRGYDLGCFTASATSVQTLPGPNLLPAFFREAARGYHRALCSHSAASTLTLPTTLLPLALLFSYK